MEYSDHEVLGRLPEKPDMHPRHVLAGDGAWEPGEEIISMTRERLVAMRREDEEQILGA